MHIRSVFLREALLARDRRKWGLTEMLDILYDEGHDRDCDCVIETKLRCSEHKTILSWFLGRRLCRWQSCATWTNNVQPACDDDNFKHQNQAFMCQSMLCVSPSRKADCIFDLTSFVGHLASHYLPNTSASGT